MDFADLGGIEQGDRFQLHPTCRLVRGTAYSAIYDLERNLLFRFDDAYSQLFELAARSGGFRLSDLGGLGGEARQKVRDAIAYLLEHEVGDFISDVQASIVAPFSLEWDSPYGIANAIIDVDDTDHDWQALFAQLEAMQCPALQIRSYSELVDPEKARAILEKLRGSCISNVEIVTKWSLGWGAESWPILFETYPNLLAVQLHSALVDDTLRIRSQAAPSSRIVLFRTSPVDGPACCGSITKGTLSVPSSGLYAELQSYNGCLNRKMSIRSNGEICNCPSMKASFGKNISRLGEIAASPEFQRAWKLRKDDFQTCRACEFRYVCTDCRAYLESDLSLAKPARCNYDPATGQWNSAGERAPFSDAVRQP